MKEIKYTILYCVFLRTFVIWFYYDSETVINYGSGSDFLTSYGSYSSGFGSTSLAKALQNMKIRDQIPCQPLASSLVSFLSHAYFLSFESFSFVFSL